MFYRLNFIFKPKNVYFCYYRFPRKSRFVCKRYTDIHTLTVIGSVNITHLN